MTYWAIPIPRDNRLCHRLYPTPQQVIGLGHQTQVFIQMPLIFMTHWGRDLDMQTN